MWYSTTKLSKKYNVTTQTIRRWIKEGKFLETKVTAGGHFRIKDKSEKTIIYARVSSRKQMTSIDNQLKTLKEKYLDAEIIFDIASAFNFERKGLKKILEYTMSGTAITLVVTNQDRLARSGFQLINYLITQTGGSIEILEKDSKPEKFDAKELVGYITSFCNFYYGKRSAEKRKTSPSL